jgi:hypothetical protein
MSRSIAFNSNIPALETFMTCRKFFFLVDKVILFEEGPYGPVADVEATLTQDLSDLLRRPFWMLSFHDEYFFLHVFGHLV